MSRWLAWLPAFRSLRHELDEAAAARIAAEDRVMRLEADMRRLYDMLAAERERSEQYSQALVNIPYQMQYGTKIFPGGPGLAVAPIAEPYRAETSTSASDERARMNARFRAESIKAFEDHHGRRATA